MVDALVSFVIERLGEYVIREVEFFRGVKGEVESMKNELEWMHCFINDAQKKQVNDDTIRRWVLDIMDIAYDCEDVLDEFIFKVHNEGIPDTLSVDQATTSERRQRFLTFLEKICCIICSKTRQQIDLYGIGKQIERLKGRLNDVSRRRQSYNLQDINNNIEGESSARGRLNSLRRISSFQLEEMNVVGYDDDTRTLLAHLLDKKKPQSFVISIFGSGGSGKTTLAGKLYHHAEIKNNFSHRAWVSVSQHYDTKDLLQRIIYSFNKDRDLPKMSKVDMTNEESMGRYLKKSLEGRSYLVVIDDIWHKEAWDSLKRAFPAENNGSRVIMTTRIRDVAERVDDSTFPYALRFLRPDESWQLFCTKAFKNSHVDQGLEQLGREMVQKCGGLPLAIIVLGGLLASKTRKEWSEIRKHIWNDMVNQNIEITYLLALSFDDLPSELKVCFLYLGLFPEDHEIKIRKLIRLWVAEGLVLQKGENTMEELAENYLDRLINRSLVQIGLTSRGRIFTCRVHDLLRDLAIRKAKELNFFCTKHETQNLVESTTSRRQAFYPGRNTPLLLQHCSLLSRSLFFFGQSSFLDLPKVCIGFRVVRVLYLDNCYFENSNNLPEEIEKLIHLKYLGLRNTSILHLPSSIGKLQSLQTLDLSTTREHGGRIQIPSEIRMLTELRHLIGCFDTKLKIDNLTKLQTLKNVHGWVWTQIKTEKLVNLRELRIYWNYPTKNGEVTLDSIANLKSLRILSITLFDGSSYFGSLEPLSHCEHLQDLNLEGIILNLPENLHELVPNLECLSLDGSNLKDDPMPKLEKLLNLTHLQLGFDSYRGRKMTCSANGFPRLEILNLCPGPLLNKWDVEQGAMHVLRDLKIVVHPEKGLSKWVRSINTLKLSARVHLERDTICRL
ncbi:putative disease resistance RPP13-like protein 3 [Mangifera indica]|uniref:putative disease resistance RPP13-like protein 3 n=1 Tax=Mangifera indica TaxID=29780 RepID=UPI001CF938BA|nr:putative disease resistance RPP13-like protein 3 [Mangifera indica]